LFSGPVNVISFNEFNADVDWLNFRGNQFFRGKIRPKLQKTIRKNIILRLPFLPSFFILRAWFLNIDKRKDFVALQSSNIL